MKEQDSQIPPGSMQTLSTIFALIDLRSKPIRQLKWETAASSGGAAEVVLKRAKWLEAYRNTGGLLCPATLDDYVAEYNPARAIEAFVGQLDLMSLGFENAEPKATGRRG